MTAPKNPRIRNGASIAAIVAIALLAAGVVFVFHAYREAQTENTSASQTAAASSVTAATPRTRAVDASHSSPLPPTADTPAQPAAADNKNAATTATAITAAITATASSPTAVTATATDADDAGALASLSPRERAIFDKIPDVRLRDEILKLTPEARFRVFKTLAANPPPDADYASLHVSYKGMLYYTCELLADGSHDDDHYTSATVTPAPADGPVPINQPPVCHSRPGSRNVLFLDFGGMDIRKTSWNYDAQGNIIANVFHAVAYNNETDTFSVQEQRDIIQIWERVAEDYSPFDVDVTTERPAVFTRTTGHALITRSKDRNNTNMPSAEQSNLVGIGFVNVFAEYDYATDANPGALVYYDRSSGATDDATLATIAYAVSHELGHNLGLSHQGTGALQSNGDYGYYGGHGVGPTSWAPIMGNGFGKSVVQWAQGDYYNANNHEDAVAIIAGKTGYRGELGATTLVTAQPLTPLADGVLGATGVIRTSATNANGDIVFPHYYAINLATSGSIAITLDPCRISGTGAIVGTTDLKLEILNATGVPVATDSPTNVTNASLARQLDAGQWYVRVTPKGTGSPFASQPTGFTVYGSLGQYTLATNLVYTSPALATALNSDLTWTTEPGSDADWFGQSVTTHDGIAAAQSGAIAQGQSTGIAATIEGTGTLTFWWKISADDSDSLAFYYSDQPDGGAPVTSIASISGQQGWKQYTFANRHTGTRYLGWAFVKASNPNNPLPTYTGAAWLDQVTWTPDNFTFTVTPDTTEAPSDAGQFTLAIKTPKTWTATTDAGWLALTSTTGDGDATLTVADEANDTAAPRRATITITSAGINRTCEVAQPIHISFATALDDNLAWTSGGYDEKGNPIDKPWTTQTLVTHDGQSAARSGIILGMTNPGPDPYKDTGEQTWLQTTVNGEGTVKFYWKVSSEPEIDEGENGLFGDICYFYIDGQEQARISGTQYDAQKDWAPQCSFSVSGTGGHTLRWLYHKDPLLSVGADAAWLDRVTWIPAGSTQIDLTPDTKQVPATSGQFTLGVDANVAWTAIADASWLAITPASGNTSVPVNVIYAANAATAARAATITLTGGGTTATCLVTQAAATTTGTTGGGGGNTPGGGGSSGGGSGSGDGGGGAPSLLSLLALALLLGARAAKRKS